MTPKRGQITVFIIIGIAILVVVGALFYFRGRGAEFSEEAETVSLEVSPVRLYISNCIKDKAETALFDNMIQGGAYELPTIVAHSGVFDINQPGSLFVYYVHEDKPDIPYSVQYHESELSANLEDNIKECANEEAFAEQKFTFRSEEPVVKTTMGDEVVLFDISFPVEVIGPEGDVLGSMKQFNVEIDAKARALIDSAQEYVELQKTDLTSVFVSDLIKIGIDNDVFVSSQYIGNNDVVFFFTDDTTSRGDDDYLTLAFAVKYKEREPITFYPELATELGISG